MPLNVVIVGSGPSGFYTAEALLEKAPDARVDVIDRLPSPFGLIRFGVAPDHQGSKKIVKRFERTAADPRVRFFGNVDVGRDVAVGELRELYDAVVFASGAALDRNLGIPGEDKKNVLGSADFVGWYNGHPDFAGLDVDLSGKAVAVVGNGNVAIDVARVLAKTEEEMSTSDLPEEVAGKIQAARLKDIYIIGRRGPVEASFTTRELKELGNLERAVPLIDAGLLPDSVSDQGDRKTQIVKEKNLEVLRGYVDNRPGDKPISIHLLFLASPVEILGDEKASGLRLVRNRLERGRAVATDESFTLPADLVVTCIGYRSRPIDGVPFDDREGRFINEDGRIASGLYAAGWAKRGPTGVISTNHPDGVNVAGHVVEDCGTGSGSTPGREGLESLLATRGCRVVDYGDWQKINAAELAAARAGAPRRKFTTVADMLAVLDQLAK
ncbi:MAG: FAD-dependent oxidoreductase [Alphaproteobacteria bacterium]